MAAGRRYDCFRNALRADVVPMAILQAVIAIGRHVTKLSAKADLGGHNASSARNLGTDRDSSNMGKDQGNSSR